MKIYALMSIVLLSLVNFAQAAPPILGDGCTSGENGSAAFLGFPARILTCNGSSWIAYTNGVNGSPWLTSGSNLYYNIGSVGIGTTSPVSKLDVDGIVSVNDDVQHRNNSNIRVSFFNASPLSFIALSARGPIDFAVTQAGNTGVGTTTPNVSAKLDISSTTQGFLPPRMSDSDRLAIPSPAEGLMVYQNNAGALGKGWYGYNGAAWEKLN